VTTEGVGALQPNHLQLVDVLGVDVSEAAVPCKRKVPARGWPLVGVSHTFQLLFVCIRHCLTGKPDRHCDNGSGQSAELHPHLSLLSLAPQFTETELT
jgi:hypothetical protein